jgi:acyl dehydratase
MCPRCGEPQRPPGGDAGYAVAAGTGRVYSYVVHHHPPVPGKTLPFVVALVELPEGVRMVGELLGVRPDQVRVGLPVQAEFVRVDDELTLPAWRPAGAPGDAAHHGQSVAPPAEPGPTGGPALPELAVEATPTFVISSALATRDFQDVHHDRDLAIARGSQDIFINILTTTGLVQRFVSGWAGPNAVLKSISIRLGAPCYAGDTLTFSGHVSAADGGDQTVTVTGRCRLGDHVTGTVRVELPGSAS